MAETILEQAQLHKKDGNLITEEPAATSEFDAVSTQPVGDLLELLVKYHAELTGGEFSRNGNSASLRWPGEATVNPVVFPGGGIEPNGELVHLDHPKIRGLLARLPVFAKGEPIPSIAIDGLPDGTTGCWSLWQLRIQSFGRTLIRIFPIFCGADGRAYTTTAGFIWDRIPATRITVVGLTPTHDSDRLFEESYHRAQEDGRELYRQLEQEHQGLWRKEQEKGRFYFAARRRLLESAGLEEVRAFRSRQIETEERRWQEAMARSKDVAPDLQAIAMANLKPR